MQDINTLIAAAPTSLGTIGPPSEKFGVDVTAGPVPVLISLEVIISSVVGILTVIAGIFFVIFFFLAAFKWQTAGGDSGKVQKARDEMIQGVIGMIIIVAAYGIIGIIGSVVGIDILNPASRIFEIVTK